MGLLIVGAHRGAGKFRSSQLGKCEWPCGTRRLLPRAEMRASMKGPAERGGHRDEKVPLRTWPAGHRGVHRSRNHRHRQPRRRWLWRDASVGRPVLGGRHGHPPGYGGPRGSRRAARARGSHPRQPRQPADPGGRTRPDHGHDPGGERGVPDRQPDRGVARPEPAFWATAGGAGARRRRAGRRAVADRNLPDNPERAGLSGRADEHCVLRGRGAHRPGHRRPDRRGLDPPPAPPVRC